MERLAVAVVGRLEAEGDPVVMNRFFNQRFPLLFAHHHLMGGTGDKAVLQLRIGFGRGHRVIQQ